MSDSLSSSDEGFSLLSDSELSLFFAASLSSFSVHFFTFFFFLVLLSAGLGSLSSDPSGFLKVFLQSRFHSFPGVFLHMFDLWPLMK